MSLINNPIYNSFIRLDEPTGYGDCEVPQVCLPVSALSDLAFQLKFLATNQDFNYLMQVNSAVAFVASQNGTTLTVTSMSGIGYIFVGNEIKVGGTSYGHITAQLTGTQGGVGTYTVDTGNIFTGYSMTTVATGITGKIGALVVGEGQTAPSSLYMGLADYICTGAAPTGKVVNVSGVNVPEWVCFFQPGSSLLNWDELPVGSCFNLCFYELSYSGNDYSGSTLTPLSTYSCFTKITDPCESYPTSLLQYANNSDAFGFYYDALAQLVDNINFVNSVRLPVYLHSPGQAEDQTTYNLSNGAALKLSHRIYTDYKFKTDWLTAEQQRALVVATAHDLLFIGCTTEGINLGGADDWAYSFTNTPTQFVRTEKVDMEWQQETMPRFKLGQAKGTIRLAEAYANTNSNC